LNSITFIHAADLHLDSPFKGLSHIPTDIFNRMKESTFRSFERLVDLAIKEKVDFVLISGDIYDAEERSLKAQIRFRDQLKKLDDHHIEVYVIHGNHDHLSGQWVPLNWPKNVHFFKEHVSSFMFKKENKPSVQIAGFSYPQREVKERMAKKFVRDENADYHIGMYHGNWEGSHDHDPYAPFSTNELIDQHFHYWALGHIHKKQILNNDPYIVYPGNIQGRHSKETGMKGCYLVTVTNESTNLSFEPTCDIVWEKVVVSIDDFESVAELYDHCEAIINKMRDREKGIFITLELQGNGVLYDHLKDASSITDLLDVLREGEDCNSSFVWVVELKNHTNPSWNREQLAKEDHFISDLLHTIDEHHNVNESLSLLLNHRAAKKIIDPFTDEECEQIKDEAERFLLSQLLDEGK
jgi:DNA repair protein SbcD/Mre11